MRTLRVLAALTWVLASLFGATASACAHEAEAASAADHDGHHAMTGSASAPMATDGAMAMDGAMAEDCDPDCCEGACACEGVTAAAALLPEAARDAPVAAAGPSRPVDTVGTAAASAREGPPPRLA